MSITVSVAEAKTQLSKLLAKAQAGEQVVIERRGDPVAVLSAATSKRVPTFGFMPGDVDEDESMAPLDADELKLWGIG